MKNNSKKTILFLSTVNLTVNPRILKEIKLASAHYNVIFIGFKLDNWSDEIEKKIINELRPNVKLVYISATRKPFLPWLIATVLNILAKKVWKYFKNSLFVNAVANNKRALLLLYEFYRNKKEYKVDLICAHTLGTIYPALVLSGELGIEFSFDIEDYHPGEKIDIDFHNEEIRSAFLLKRILPKTVFFSYAAPLIGSKIVEILGKRDNSQVHFYIKNCFSKNEFSLECQKEINPDSQFLNFVWYSQNINFGRGLELIIPALANYKNLVRLYLIGYLHENFKKQLILPNSDFIEIIDPLPQLELNLLLSDFDVGLAIELNSADLNRDLSITNKIYSYYQAGLFILATDTNAQIEFIQERKNHGMIVKQNEEKFRESIYKLILDKEKIRKTKKKRFDLAIEESWEFEQKKLLKAWNNIL